MHLVVQSMINLHCTCCNIHLQYLSDLTNIVFLIRHRLNLNPIIPDPFADAAKGDEDGVQDGLVHIRIQQRNGRKTLTTIQGLSAEYDLKKIVRACKKVWLWPK